MDETTNESLTTTDEVVQTLRAGLVTTPTEAMNEKRRSVEAILNDASRAGRGGIRYTSVYLMSSYDYETKDSVYDGKIEVHIALEDEGKGRSGTLNFHLPVGAKVIWNPSGQSVEI